MNVLEAHIDLIEEVERLLIDWRFRRLVASIEQTVRVHQPPADGSTPSRPLNQRVALGLDGLLNPHTSTGRGANPDQ